MGQSVTTGSIYSYFHRVFKPIIRYASKKKTTTLESEFLLAHANAIFQVAPQYLSFSIDISVLAGGYWWEGSKGIKNGLGTLRTSPLDLTNKKLDRLVQGLGQSYLRVGGSEADNIQYFCHSYTESRTDDKSAKNTPLKLTEEIWLALHKFLQRNDLSLYFTFRYGLFSRAEHGQWQIEEAKALFDYCNQHQLEIAICELGNELNAYWAFYGLQAQPMAKRLAADYLTFIRLVRECSPTTKISGPGSAFWPRIGETIAPLSNLSLKFLESLSCSPADYQLDIVDWHYYPFQSKRSPVRTRTATISSVLSPKSYIDFGKYARQLSDLRDRFQPDAELWTGETGSAQCGGEPKLSDRFASCFWWADQLGQGAINAQKVMIRQSLIGGDYGLINRKNLKPRPDYWVSWLWVRLMGENVYDIKSDTRFLRIYCHQSALGNGKTILLINMSKYEIKTSSLNCYTILASYEINAKRLRSKKIRINGKQAKMKKSGLELADFPRGCTSLSKLKPFSITFVCIDDISAPGDKAKD